MKQVRGMPEMQCSTGQIFEDVAQICPGIHREELALKCFRFHSWADLRHVHGTCLWCSISGITQTTFVRPLILDLRSIPHSGYISPRAMVASGWESCVASQNGSFHKFHPLRSSVALSSLRWLYIDGWIGKAKSGTLNGWKFCNFLPLSRICTWTESCATCCSRPERARQRKSDRSATRVRKSLLMGS